MTATLYTIAEHPDAWAVLVVLASLAMFVAGGVLLFAFDNDDGFPVLLVAIALLVGGGIAGFITVAGNVGEGMRECVARGGRVVTLERDRLCEVAP